MSAPRIPESLQRAWLTQLHWDWSDFNRKYLDGRLRAPQFALDDRSVRLGAWRAQTRTIQISRLHLWRDTWADVRLTLRHEMAHQVVDELFAAPGAPAHGALFERACQQLDLTQSPRLPAEPDPESARTLDRVRKLLNLAGSTNVHEAQSAMAAANRLLLKANLTRSALDSGPSSYRFRWLGSPLGRIPLEHKVLAGLLQDHFFVRCIWLGTHRARDAKPVSRLEVVGQPHNLDIAEYVHGYLVATVDRLWTAYRATLPRGAARRARNNYRVGVMMGFGEHLRAQARTHEAEGLVWLGDAALDEVFADRHPSSRRLGGGYYRQDGAHDAGRRDGRRIRLQPGLDEAPTQRGRLLGD